MLPLSILIILEEAGIFSFDLFVDKLVIGAILLIGLQVVSLVFSVKHQGGVRAMNIVIGVVLIIPALIYLIPALNFFGESLSLILGTMMFVESVYAFH
jgi:hypothetical protein